jgi:hypothetical protein
MMLSRPFGELDKLIRMRVFEAISSERCKLPGPVSASALAVCTGDLGTRCGGLVSG